MYCLSVRVKNVSFVSKSEEYIVSQPVCNFKIDELLLNLCISLFLAAVVTMNMLFISYFTSTGNFSEAGLLLLLLLLDTHATISLAIIDIFFFY